MLTPKEKENIIKKFQVHKDDTGSPEVQTAILTREIEKVSDKAGIFKGLKGDIYTYFCHSYFVAPKKKEVTIGKTEYGVTFASVIKQGKVYGMQFHPEKSQEVGLKLLENFILLN